MKHLVAAVMVGAGLAGCALFPLWFGIGFLLLTVAVAVVGYIAYQPEGDCGYADTPFGRRDE